MAETPDPLVPFNDPDLVVLRNPVARARFHLSVYQTQFLLEVLAYLKSRPNDRTIEFSLREFNKTLNVNSNNLKHYVNEIRKMVQHVISIPTEERTDGGIRLKEVALIAAIETDINGRGEGYIKVEVADMIKPYFLEIANGQFFSFHKHNASVLRGKHTISLYMLLKSYQRFGVLTIDYKELREILTVQPTEYNPFKEFKRWVLEKSRQEMLEKNDIYFDYEPIRASSSRKSEIIKIAFQIKKNPTHKATYAQPKTAKPATSPFIRSIEAVVFEEPAAETTPQPLRLTPTETLKTSAKPKKATVKSKNTEGSVDGGFPISDVGTSASKTRNRTTNTRNTEGSAVGLFAPPQANASREAMPLNVEIERMYRFFDKETPVEVVKIFVDGLKTYGFEEERILDVLHFAHNRMEKGEKIRNIMGYMKHGLDTGIMGKGLAKMAEQKNQANRLHSEVVTALKHSNFTAYLQQFYINKGIDADNDLKIDFISKSRQVKAMAHFFDEKGQLLEAYKDKFRESLGKRLSAESGETEQRIFIRWYKETQGVDIELVNDKWRLKVM